MTLQHSEIDLTPDMTLERFLGLCLHAMTCTECDALEALEFLMVGAVDDEPHVLRLRMTREVMPAGFVLPANGIRLQ